MSLIRAFSRVDKDGKIKLPGNIKGGSGMKSGQLVELKILGTGKKSILVTFPPGTRVPGKIKKFKSGGKKNG